MRLSTQFVYSKVDSAWAAVFRIVIWMLFAMLGARIVLVALWQMPEPAFHRGVVLTAVSVLFALFRPGWGLVWVVVSMPLLFAAEWFGYWLPSVAFEVVAGAYVVAWTIRQAVNNRKFFRSSTLVEWMVDLFAALLIISMLAGASYPSLRNSLDMFLSVPVEYPLSEFEWINIGQFMILGCAFFRIASGLISELSCVTRRVMWLIWVILAIWAGFSFCQLVSHAPPPLSEEGFGLFSPFQSIHMAGAFGLLLLGFLIAFVKELSVGRFRFLASWFPVVVTLALVMLTFAKSAWVGVVVVVLLGAIRKLRWKATAGIAAGILILAVGARVMVSWRSAPTTEAHARMENFLFLENWASQPANQQRLSVYANALKILGDYRLSGIGLGQFRRMQQYLGKVNELIYSDTFHWKIPHDTHNQVLQIAAEMGLTGAGLLLLILALLAANGWISEGQQGSSSSLRWGGTLALAAVCAFSMFESSLTWRAANIFFWLTAAVAFSPTRRDEEGAAQAPGWVVPAGFLLTAIFLVASFGAALSLRKVPQYFGYSQWSIEHTPGEFSLLRESRFPVQVVSSDQQLRVTLPSRFPDSALSQIRYRIGNVPFTEVRLNKTDQILIDVPHSSTTVDGRVEMEIHAQVIFSDTGLGIGAEKRPYALSILRVTGIQKSESE